MHQRDSGGEEGEKVLRLNNLGTSKSQCELAGSLTCQLMTGGFVGSSESGPAVIS